MNNSSRLNADEIMCLQMAGLSTSEIIKIDLPGFEELYKSNQIYEEYIGKANAILDRQEDMAISAMILAQCPEHSGSLYTMRFARKYGKQCFVSTYTHRTDGNAGNYSLIESNLAMPLCL